VPAVWQAIWIRGEKGLEDALSVIAEDSSIATVAVPIEESRDIVGALYRLGCAYAYRRYLKRSAPICTMLSLSSLNPCSA